MAPRKESAKKRLARKAKEIKKQRLVYKQLKPADPSLVTLDLSPPELVCRDGSAAYFLWGCLRVKSPDVDPLCMVDVAFNGGWVVACPDLVEAGQPFQVHFQPDWTCTSGYVEIRFRDPRLGVVKCRSTVRIERSDPDKAISCLPRWIGEEELSA